MPYVAVNMIRSLHCLRHAIIEPELEQCSCQESQLEHLGLGPRSPVMQAQAVALHVTMPELTTLNGALDRLDDFQNRAKECLR